MSRERYGEGAIFKTSDGRGYRGQMEVGEDENGKRLRQWFRGKTKREVQDKMMEVRLQLKQGLPTRTTTQTVKQYLVETWLKDVVRPRVSLRSYEGYEQMVRLYILPTLGRHKLADLTPEQVQALLNKLRRRKNEETGDADPLSERTVQYVWTTLHAAYRRAYKWGMVPRNIMDLVDRPTVRPPEIHPLDPDQTRTFLKAIKGHRLEALFTVAVVEGLRQGEILGLRWSDLQLNKGRLTVAHSLTRSPEEGLHLKEPKNRSSRRTISLSQITITALKAHREAQASFKWARGSAGLRWDDTGYVFTSSVGTALEPSGVVKAFKDVLQKAGLPNLRFHDLRHTCASLLIRTGAHPRVVMDKLGHSTIQIGMNLYGHIFSEQKREQADAIDRLLADEEQPTASQFSLHSSATHGNIAQNQMAAGMASNPKE